MRLSSIKPISGYLMRGRGRWEVEVQQLSYFFADRVDLAHVSVTDINQTLTGERACEGMPPSYHSKAHGSRLSTFCDFAYAKIVLILRRTLDILQSELSLLVKENILACH